MSNTGRVVLALDDLVSRPEFEAMLRTSRSRQPTWHDDQLLAAAQETRSIHDLLVERGLFARGDDVSHAEVPSWIRLGILQALVGWLSGEGSTCMHSPSPQRPEPLVAAAWKPGLMVCAKCEHLLVFRPGSIPDRTCDGCGHITTGPEHDDGIFGNAIQMGPLTYRYGVCRLCEEVLPVGVA